MSDKVILGILDNGENWDPAFGISYADLLVYDMCTNQHIVGRRRKIAGASGIAPGRNEVVNSFLTDTDGRWLFFVDTDMGFEPDTVDRLLKSADPQERPVMGALCFGQKHKAQAPMNAHRFRMQPTILNWAEIKDPPEVGVTPVMDYPRDQVIQVGATGAACVLIHRSALEKMHERYGPTWFDMATHPTAGAGKPRTFSEDISFCLRANACGIPIHVDTAIKTTHHKGGIFLDEETYDLQQAAK